MKHPVASKVRRALEKALTERDRLEMVGIDAVLSAAGGRRRARRKLRGPATRRQRSR